MHAQNLGRVASVTAKKDFEHCPPGIVLIGRRLQKSPNFAFTNVAGQPLPRPDVSPTETSSEPRVQGRRGSHLLPAAAQ